MEAVSSSYDTVSSSLQKMRYSELSFFHIQSRSQTVSNVKTIEKLWKRLREDTDTKDGKISETAFVRIVSSLFRLKNNDLPHMLFKRISLPRLRHSLLPQQRSGRTHQ